MKRSFLRLVVVSVVTCWVVGFAIVAVHSRGRSWIDERARTDGVFLAYELLDQEAVAQRTERLRRLQPHFSVDFTLFTREEVERRIGRRAEAGEQIPQRISPREEWYFLVFNDGEGALAAGPVHPAMPAGVVPIGVIVGIVAIPVLAGFIALRVQRELTKVERATQALATGELSARVDNPHGPSNELAASFNAMAERVERLIRSRDELVQAVSHELGSPLSRLRFHLALLEDTSDDAGEERVGAMTRELDALDELVAELLGYVQSDEMALERREFDPHRSLTDLAELARLEAPEDRAVEVDLELPGDTTVLADPRLFQRAVENLLRNAVRYARGRVMLKLTDADDGVRVAVHDDGPGIPAEQREKVTNPFVRLDVDRGRKTGGVGLGLAIVRRIVDRHGGRLAIDDSSLGGAQVTIVWPKSAADANSSGTIHSFPRTLADRSPDRPF